MFLTKVKSNINKVFPSIFPPYNPLSNWIDIDDYTKLTKYPRFTNGHTTFLGNQIEFTDSLGLLHSIKEIFATDIYDFQINKKNPCIVDCGSNVGLSIIYFKRKFPNAKIIGFEPDPIIFKILEKNIKTFKLQDVVLHETAVWTEETTLQFFSEGSLAGSTEVQATNNKCYDVKTTDLKKILKTEQVDFLKIDIEGAETVLLPDIANQLQSIPYVFIEYHSIAGKKQKLGAILNTLTDAGFRYYVQNASDNLHSPLLTSVTDGFDLQLNIFCKKI